jgi:4-hydroxybenzoate polyprenyltransferase
LSWDTTTFLKLGRVSNLPTVWTNTLAGVVLAGSAPTDWRFMLLLAAMSLAYTGGMFLNDAFDRNIDAKERPERPVPSGEVTASSVFVAGFGMLAAAVILVAWCALGTGGIDTGGMPAVVAAIALVLAIIAYNAWHKTNPFSPLIMGLCRMLVYITAGWTLSRDPSSALYFGAVVLLCYLIGLTYTAKQENLGEVKNLWPLVFLAVPFFYAASSLSSRFETWLITLAFVAWLLYALRFVQRRGSGDIPRAVVSMIAGISLVDAIFIASVAGDFWWVLLAVAGFALTLFLQRYVAGT